MSQNHSSKVKQHRIQTDSEDQFITFIHSLDWEVNPPAKDYGVDYWVQVFVDGNPTGGDFFVQLKGTDNIEQYRLRSKEVLSYSLPAVKLKTWQRSLLPLVVVLWDTANKRGYWLHVQAFISEKIQQNPNWLDNERQNRKVHIPLNQTIAITDDKTTFESAIDALMKQFRDAQKTQEIILQIRDSAHFDVYAFFEELSHISPIPPQVSQQQRLAILEAKLHTNPNDVTSLVERASIYYELNEMDKALAAINTAWELDRGNAEIAWPRGCVLAEYAIAHKGQPKWMLYEAIGLFQSCALIAHPGTLHYNIGNSLAALGEHANAIESYDKALASDPLPDLASQIWKNKGTSHFHLGQHQIEVKCYQKSLELNPERWEAYASWAATELHMGNYREARRLFLKAEGVFPHWGRHVSSVYSLAFSCWKLGLNEEALERANQVLKVDPNYEDALTLKSYTLMSLWRQDSNYVESAANHYKLMLLDDPENMLAKSELHLILVAKGDLEAARKVIEDAVQSDDVPSQVLYDYAMLLEGEGKLDKAISQLERAFEVNQEHHIVHNLARLKEEVGDYRQAIQFYQLAIVDAHNPSSILSSIADCYFRLGEFKNCIETIMKLIQREPDRTIWWNNLNYALVHMGLGTLAYKMRSKLRKAEQNQPFTHEEIESTLKEIREAIEL